MVTTERIAVWPIVACIASAALLRAGSFAAGVLLGLQLAALARDEPVPETFIGLLAAVFYTVELIGAPLAGVWGDRYGQRPFLLTGPLIGAFSVQLLGVASLRPLLLLVMATKGLSVALSIPSTLAYLSYATRSSDRLRTTALAWFEVASVIGIGAGGLLGGVLWNWLGGWSFTALTAIYLLAFVLLATISGADVPRASREAVPLRQLARMPSVIRFAPAWIAVNAIVGLWVNHAPFLLAQPKRNDQLLQGGYDGLAVGIVFAIVGLTLGAGILAWGRWLAGRSRLVGMRVGAWGFVALCLVLALLNHSGVGWGAVQIALTVAVVAMLFVVSGFTPAALAYLADIAEGQPASRGAILGFYSVFFGVGQVIGALLGGPAAQQFGADGVIGLTLLLSLLVFGSLWLLADD